MTYYIRVNNVEECNKAIKIINKQLTRKITRKITSFDKDCDKYIAYDLDDTTCFIFTDVNRLKKYNIPPYIELSLYTKFKYNIDTLLRPSTVPNLIKRWLRRTLSLTLFICAFLPLLAI